MKKRVLGIFNYLLSAFLGFWALAFMASSAFIIKTAFWGIENTARVEMYDSIRFGVSAAVSAAAVFQFFMILIAIVLLALGLVQIMKLHGLRLPAFVEKVYALRVAKKFDLVILLAFAFTFFSLLAMICLAAHSGQITAITNATNYTRGRIGFGPVWLFLSGAAVSAALLFSDKVVAFLNKDKKAADTAKKDEEEEIPLADIPPAEPIKEHDVTEPEVSAYTAHHDSEVKE